jgi:DNA-binding GntR family transcriptional regulator
LIDPGEKAGLFDYLQDVEHRTAQETVVASLREAIIGGLLSGGTRLVQSKLSAQLGVSTTPVREAMRQLAAEGLIRMDPFRGAIVHTPTLDEVREVYELRLLLEPVAIRKASEHLTADELAAAGQLQRQMDGVTDGATWVLMNREFHGRLLRASGAPRLSEFIERLITDATSQVALSIKADPRRMAEGNREHKRILLALQRRDMPALDRLVTEHLRATVHAIEHLAAQPATGGGRVAKATVRALSKEMDLK